MATCSGAFAAGNAVASLGDAPLPKPEPEEEAETPPPVRSRPSPASSPCPTSISQGDTLRMLAQSSKMSLDAMPGSDSLTYTIPETLPNPSAEAPCAKPVEALCPKPPEALSPKPVEATSPKPVEATSPKPLEALSPKPLEVPWAKAASEESMVSDGLEAPEPTALVHGSPSEVAPARSKAGKGKGVGVVPAQTDSKVDSATPVKLSTPSPKKSASTPSPRKGFVPASALNAAPKKALSKSHLEPKLEGYWRFQIVLHVCKYLLGFLL